MRQFKRRHAFILGVYLCGAIAGAGIWALSGIAAGIMCWLAWHEDEFIADVPKELRP